MFAASFNFKPDQGVGHPDQRQCTFVYVAIYIEGRNRIWWSRHATPKHPFICKLNWRVSSRVRAISLNVQTLKVQTLKVRISTKTRNEYFFCSPWAFFVRKRKVEYSGDEGRQASSSASLISCENLLELSLVSARRPAPRSFVTCFSAYSNFQYL